MTRNEVALVGGEISGKKALDISSTPVDTRDSSPQIVRDE
jgi:hypothetical protein